MHRGLGGLPRWSPARPDSTRDSRRTDLWYDRAVPGSTIHAQQRERLEAVIAWAERIRSTLGPVLRANGHRVHFRPASTGVAMVGLLPHRPQRGKSGIRDLQRLADDFENQFTRHCIQVEQGRVTGEKALQSWLIRDAQTHEGRLHAINEASRATEDPVELLFVADEISLPVEGSKIVCDVLGLRVDAGRSTPVLLELKDSRQLTRLVEQVYGYAAQMNGHADLFAKLYSVLLGREVVVNASAEKWIVWPMAGDALDPRDRELARRGVRVVAYDEHDDTYRFRVGPTTQRLARANR